MGRSTFEGPVLSGNNRFGPLRNVGYQRLSQNCILDFAATGGSGTAGGGCRRHRVQIGRAHV